MKKSLSVTTPVGVFTRNTESAYTHIVCGPHPAPCVPWYAAKPATPDSTPRESASAG